MAKPAIQDVSRSRPAVEAPARAVRFPNLLGLERDLPGALDTLDAWVIGAGSVGEAMCNDLARLHPRSLTIVDPGTFKPENLLTQNITPDAIGRNKAEYVGEYCAQLAPQTRVRFFSGRAEELPLAALGSAGIVMLATDNLRAEVDVAQRCLHAGVPLIQASVYGDMLVAQVRFCGNIDAAGPCLACLWGPDEWQHLNRETVFSCQGGGHDGAAQRPANREPTRSTSSLCWLAANLAMMQIPRHLGGLGAAVADTHLDYCGFTHATAVSPLKRNDQCVLEHRRWERRQTQRSLETYTPRNLANIALGHFRTTDGISLTIDDLQFCETGVCSRSGTQQPVDRFVATLRGAHHCAECGGPVDGLPFCSHRPIPLALLRHWIDRPLREILDGTPEAIVVGGPNAAVLCQHSAANDRTNP